MLTFGWQISKMNSSKKIYFEIIDEYIKTQNIRGDRFYENFEN